MKWIGFPFRLVVGIVLAVWFMIFSTVCRLAWAVLFPKERCFFDIEWKRNLVNLYRWVVAK